MFKANKVIFSLMAAFAFSFSSATTTQPYPETDRSFQGFMHRILANTVNISFGREGKPLVGKPQPVGTQYQGNFSKHYDAQGNLNLKSLGHVPIPGQDGRSVQVEGTLRVSRLTLGRALFGAIGVAGIAMPVLEITRQLLGSNVRHTENGFVHAPVHNLEQTPIIIPIGTQPPPLIRRIPQNPVDLQVTMRQFIESSFSPEIAATFRYTGTTINDCNAMARFLFPTEGEFICYHGLHINAHTFPHINTRNYYLFISKHTDQGGMFFYTMRELKAKLRFLGYELTNAPQCQPNQRLNTFGDCIVPLQPVTAESIANYLQHLLQPSHVQQISEILNHPEVLPQIQPYLKRDPIRVTFPGGMESVTLNDDTLAPQVQRRVLPNGDIETITTTVTRTATVVNNDTPEPGIRFDERKQVTRIVTNAQGQIILNQDLSPTAQNQPQPQSIMCGLPGTPPCRIYEPSTMPLAPTDDAKQTIEAIRNDIQQCLSDIPECLGLPDISFSFRMPTACSSLVLPGFDRWLQPIDICIYKPYFHSVMGMVWAITGVFGAMAIIGRRW